MLDLWIPLALVAAIALILLSSAAVTAWRRERRRSQLLAERLLVESHLEQLTAETLQAMRKAVRERLRAGR